MCYCVFNENETYVLIEIGISSCLIFSYGVSLTAQVSIKTLPLFKILLYCEAILVKVFIFAVIACNLHPISHQIICMCKNTKVQYYMIENLTHALNTHTIPSKSAFKSAQIIICLSNFFWQIIICIM